LLIISLLLFPKNGFAAKRVALVIGNSNYRDAPLRNPANDASDIAAALKRLNFNVVLIKNASERDMKRAIRSFGQSLSAAEVRLFYYAGHGMQVRGTNYLIPLGAEVSAEDEVEYEAVDAGLVLSKMRSSSPGVNIILLDACRNNPFARSFRSGSRGLARMDAPTGTIIAYATAPGGVAADGSGRNGLFTKHLLKHIERKGMALDDVLRRVRKGVAQETSSKQVPWASESLLTEVFLCGPSGEMLADGSTYAAPADQSPKLGSLRIESQPTGADIFMNNKYIGISPLTLNDLSTGRVTIRAQKSGYSSREKVTSVLSGQTNFVSFPLSSVKRIASPARLYVSPYPEDAKIRILNIGPRYSRGMTLKPGRYHVEVSKPGYKTTRRWVTLSDGNLNVSINLEKRDSVSSKDIPVAQKSKYGPNLRRARARAESLRLTADRVLRPGDDLRQAVSGAKSGATFVLERGVYRVRGEWKIKRPVHLVGAGPDAVEIIIEKFSINAPGGMVKFEGLSVRMDSNLKRAAIYASNSNVLLENCRVSGAIYSGFESSGGRAVATACEITGNKAAGIFIYKGCKGTFRGNHIRNNDLQGISVKTDADALVEGNLIENNKQAGIYVYKNGKGTFTNNFITGNGLQGIAVTSGANPTARNNQIVKNKEAGIFAYDKGLGNFRNNHIAGNRLQGVAVKTGADPIIDGNQIQNNKEAGIYVYKNGKGTFRNNSITGNTHQGLAVKDGANPMVENNRIMNNRQAGIYVYENGRGTFRDNHVTGNGHQGVLVKGGANPVVENNIIKNNSGNAIWSYSGGKGQYFGNQVSGPVVGVSSW